jgi:Ca2+-binding RTX toxin-like protein
LDPSVDITDTGTVLGINAGGILTNWVGAPWTTDINVDGTILTTGTAINLWNKGGEVTVGEDGIVQSTGDTGIWAIPLSTAERTIFNDGRVVGQTGISLGNGDDTIVNTGLIRGVGGTAILTYGGDDEVTNAGRIRGDVYLGSGEDIFTQEVGSRMTGTVNGGLGNDTYRIVNNDLTLEDDGGIDLVESTVTHTLGDAFENLRLLGIGDVDGKGNGSNNVMAGNAGNNVLRGCIGNDIIMGAEGADKVCGGRGHDLLNGGLGDDILKGGRGQDTFMFIQGTGHDTIQDFNPMSAFERIDVSWMPSITGYNDLLNNHMTQEGEDVVIDAGDGDMLTLVGIEIDDLDASDFLF